MCFTVPLTGGTPSSCGKCTFYVVKWKCVRITGSVSSLLKRGRKRESGGQHRNWTLLVFRCYLNWALSTHTHTRTHDFQSIPIYCTACSENICRAEHGTYNFLFPLIFRSPSCKPWQRHITTQHALRRPQIYRAVSLKLKWEKMS